MTSLFAVVNQFAQDTYHYDDWQGANRKWRRTPYIALEAILRGIGWAKIERWLAEVSFITTHEIDLFMQVNGHIIFLYFVCQYFFGT